MCQLQARCWAPCSCSCCCCALVAVAVAVVVVAAVAAAAGAIVAVVRCAVLCFAVLCCDLWWLAVVR